MVWSFFNWNWIRNSYLRTVKVDFKWYSELVARYSTNSWHFGLLIAGSCFNHSCDANVDMYMGEAKTNRRIEKGDELTVFYGKRYLDKLGIEQRKVKLLKSWGIQRIVPILNPFIFNFL